MIRNVVFDVGGVLVRLRYQPFINYLAAVGIDMSSLPLWLERVGLAAHERGEITGEETHHGFVCLDASRPIVVLAYYSESRPQGSATIVSPAYRAEAEAFLRSIAVTPRQAPMARDAEGPASRQ